MMIRAGVSWPLLAGVVAMLGCGGPEAETETDVRSEAVHPAGADHGAETGHDAGGAGPSLLAIMRGLEADMVRVDRGLWAGRLDSVAVAARTLADHPQIGPADRSRIMETLGERAPGFARIDGEVHEASVQLAERAAAGDEAGVLNALDLVQRGCVACHTQFREELRTTAPPAD